MRKSRLIIIIVFLGLAYFLLTNLVLTNTPTELNISEFKSLELSEQISYLDLAAANHDATELNKFIKKAYPDEPNDKHELSHKLGELVVKRAGISGFGLCDSLLQFGCFHGAALAAVRLYGNDPQLAEQLWVACKENAKLPGSCLHGLGHAIMIINNYNLISAYEECERLLEIESESYWCQDGVAMENITRSMASANLGNYGKLDDLNYPCNSIPEKYEVTCVRNHIGHLHRTWTTDLVKLFEFCGAFTNNNTARECTQMLGSIIAEKYMNNLNELERNCKNAGQFFAACVEGAVISFSMSKQFEKAQQICAILNANEKTFCLNTIESFQSS